MLGVDFVGRQNELERLAAFVRGGRRLVTILGPAGVGKTTLVRYFLECESEQAEREKALFVGLSEIGNTREMLARVSDRLSQGELVNRVENNAGAIAEELAARKVRWLVLDNLEQLLPEAESIIQHWLEGWAELSIVVTSRRRVGSPAEQLLELEPLEAPPERGEEQKSKPEEYEACELFARRLRRLKPEWELDEEGWEQIAEIVRHLEGLPLAIELVASRCRLIGLSELAAQVCGSGGTDSGVGGEPRLRQALEDTWEHLDEELRRGLGLLTSFHGPFSVSAAAALLNECGVGAPGSAHEYLGRLRDQSLLKQTREGRLGFYDYIRAFVADKFEEMAVMREARLSHARYFAERGRRQIESYRKKGSLTSLQELSGDLAEFQVAFERHVDAAAAAPGVERTLIWALLEAIAVGIERMGSRDRRVRFMAALREQEFWSVVIEEAPASLVSSLLLLLGSQRQFARGEELLARWKGKESNDFEAIGLDFGRARLANDGRRFEEALELSERWMDRNLDEDCRLFAARLLVARGNAFSWLGQWEKARNAWAEAWRRMEELGADYCGAIPLANLCFVHSETGDPTSAEYFGQRALRIFQEIGDRDGVAIVQGYLGVLAINWGDYSRARQSFLEAREVQPWTRQTVQVAMNASNLAQAAIALGDYEEATENLVHSDAIARVLKNELVLTHNEGLRVALLLARGELEKGLAALRQAVARLEGQDHSEGRIKAYLLDFSSRLAALTAVLGESSKAEAIFSRCRTLREGVDDPAILIAEEVRRALDPNVDWSRLAPKLAILLHYPLCGEDPPRIDEKPGWHNNICVREALQFVWPRIESKRRIEIEARARDPECQCFVVSEDRRLFRVPGSLEFVDLGDRLRLIKLVELLMEARQADQPVDEEAITAALWPGERIAPGSLSNRIYNAIALLRREGLRPLLKTDDEGRYLLDRELRSIEVSAATSWSP